MSLIVTPAEIPDDLPIVRTLFREYADGLPVDLCTQNFDDELMNLPGKYAAPEGCVLVARVGATPVGCVALRPLDDGTCEMKRLYVRPNQRGTGAGRRLVERLIAEARARGYPAMRLDTIPALMPEAMGLYRKFGFVETQPYWNNILPGVGYFELWL